MALLVGSYTDNPGERVKLIGTNTVVEDKVQYLCNGADILTLYVPSNTSIGFRFSVVGQLSQFRVVSQSGTVRVRLNDRDLPEYIGRAGSSAEFNIIDNTIVVVNTSNKTLEYGYPGIVAGYTTGGLGPANAVYTTIDRIAFSTETVTLVNALSVGRTGQAGVSSDDTAYVVGGRATAGMTTDIHRFKFDTDAVETLLTNVLTTAIETGGSLSSRIAGYVIGGYSATTSIVKLVFSADNTNSVIGNLTVGGVGGTGQCSTNKGYYVDNSNIGSMTFSTDTTNATVFLGNVLPAGPSSIDYGYGVGYVTTFVTPISKMSFDTEVISNLAGGLLATRLYVNIHSSIDKGYMSGGFTSVSSAALDTIEHIDYTTDTRHNSTTTLTQARGYSGTNHY